jgi:hypothetical protein
MAITPDVEKWLQDAGYEYHCFISWAHTGNEDMTECARRVKDAIEKELSLFIPSPKVFLDEVGITGGADWRTTLMRALCKSIVMVAVCAPIYYHPSHKWCGQEWAAMDMLGQKRLPGEDFRLIIPIIVRMSDPLPVTVSEIQYIDFSRVTIRGRSYYRTIEFREKIRDIIDRIEQIALAIVRNQSKADCEQFQFPSEPAFSKYQEKSRPFPLRS